MSGNEEVVFAGFLFWQHEDGVCIAAVQRVYWFLEFLIHSKEND